MGEGIDVAEKEVDLAKKTAAIIGGVLVVPGIEIPHGEMPEDELKTNLNSARWFLDGAKIEDINEEYEQPANDGTLKLCPLE